MPPARKKSSTRRPGRKLIKFDRAFGHRFVAGADEVGRGCLAGPLVAASVVFDYDTLIGPAAAPLGHLDDSKKLSPELREHLYDAILATASAYSIVLVAPGTIDRRGLHVSNLRALAQTLQRVRRPIGVALVDGFQVTDPRFHCERIIKGDSTSAAIAAASVIAKVTRDRLMCRLDDEFDNRWAFADHMGYATPLHHERIREHGVSRLHRRSFDSVAYEDHMWHALTETHTADPLVSAATFVAATMTTPDASASERVPDVIHLLDTPGAVAVDQEHVEPVVLNPVL